MKKEEEEKREIFDESLNIIVGQWKFQLNEKLLFVRLWRLSSEGGCWKMEPELTTMPSTMTRHRQCYKKKERKKNSKQVSKRESSAEHYNWIFSHTANKQIFKFSTPPFPWTSSWRGKFDFALLRINRMRRGKCAEIMRCIGNRCRVTNGN